MLAVNFAACSNDDDDKEDAKPSIVESTSKSGPLIG